MAAKGYDYADQEEMYAYFYGTDVNGQWVEGEFSATGQRGRHLAGLRGAPRTVAKGVSVGVATTIMVEGGGSGGEYAGPEYDMEAAAATHRRGDRDSRPPTTNARSRYDDLYEEIYQEYQQRFIDENLDRLIAFRDENS